MSRFHFSPALAAGLCLAGGLPLLQAAKPPAPTGGPRSGHWAHEASALAPDEHVTWGRLDNGVRFALLPHRGVPGSVSLRFVVLAGSIDEQPDEAGLAHFSEHMAFRGAKNFKSADMVALFQRAGMEYGSDVNAVTTHHFTSFMIDYRENSPALLRDGLRFFRDIGDGPAFDPVAINLERRVILAEKLSRGSLTERKQQDSYPVVFRGLTFARHEPIGTEQHILSFTREQFVRFHERCYRPDLMLLVAAGDFDVAVATALVREIFGDMPPARTPPPPRDEGQLDANGLRAGVFRISGVGGAETLAASVTAPTGKPDSRGAQVERQRRQFVMELLGERLRSRVPGITGSRVGYETLFGYEAGLASAWVDGKEWAHGILALDEIIRNTLRHGFEGAEIEALRTRQLGVARHTLEQVPTLDPHPLCDSLSDSITNHTVFAGLEREQAWAVEWLEKLTAAEVLQTFRGLWNIDLLAFHVGGDVDSELTPDAIVKKVQQYRRGGLAYLPPPLIKESLPTLRPVGQPTKVEERRPVPELGAVLIRFGNNVRLNLVPNRQEPGLARAVVRVGTGLIDMPGRQPALKEFGLNTLLASGTSRYRAEQLSRLAEERLLEFGFDLGDRDAFTFRGQMGAENLETFLGIVAEYLHGPEFSNSVHGEERMKAANNRSAGSVGMQEGMRDLTNRLFLGDPRFTWGKVIDYISLSVVDVRRWMEPALTRGYVEVTLVGDLAEDRAVGAVARTLGALGPRAATKPAIVALPAKVTARAGFERIEFVGEHHLGLAVGTWPVSGALNMRDHAALEVLTKVLELRIREQVRDNLGLSYAPAATFEPYEGLGGLALLQATADCAPPAAERAARTFTAVAAQLAREGVTPGEFAGASGILQSQMRREFLENSFLVSMLLRAQEKPETLDEALALRHGLIGKITLEEVNAWAQRVLPADNSRTASLEPKEFIGIFESAKP